MPDPADWFKKHLGFAVRVTPALDGGSTSIMLIRPVDPLRYSLVPANELRVLQGMEKSAPEVLARIKGDLDA